MGALGHVDSYGSGEEGPGSRSMGFWCRISVDVVILYREFSEAAYFFPLVVASTSTANPANHGQGFTYLIPKVRRYLRTRALISVPHFSSPSCKPSQPPSFKNPIQLSTPHHQSHQPSTMNSIARSARLNGASALRQATPMARRAFTNGSSTAPLPSRTSSVESITNS